LEVNYGFTESQCDKTSYNGTEKGILIWEFMNAVKTNVFSKLFLSSVGSYYTHRLFPSSLIEAELTYKKLHCGEQYPQSICSPYLIMI